MVAVVDKGCSDFTSQRVFLRLSQEILGLA